MVRNGVFRYAKLLDTIGNEVINISNQLLNMNGERIRTIDDARNEIERLKKCTEGYRACHNKLLTIGPILELNQEHNELIGSFKEFYEGTSSLSRSIIISTDNTFSIDHDLFSRGIKKQKEGEQKVILSVQKIIHKLESLNLI